jgi:hypothetical protein
MGHRPATAGVGKPHRHAVADIHGNHQVGARRPRFILRGSRIDYLIAGRCRVRMYLVQPTDVSIVFEGGTFGRFSIGRTAIPVPWIVGPSGVLANSLCQGFPNLAGGGALQDVKVSVGLVGAYCLAQEAAQAAGTAVYQWGKGVNNTAFLQGASSLRGTGRDKGRHAVAVRLRSKT